MTERMSNFITDTFNKLTETLRLKEFLGRVLNYAVDKYLTKYSNVSEKNIKWCSFYPVQDAQANSVELKPQAVNEALDGIPFEVVEGYVELIHLKVPWSTLNQSPTTIHLQDVDITVRPKAPSNKAAQLLEAMSASMIHSMDSSIRMAETVLENEGHSFQNECVSLIAEYIEKVKQMLHVTMENITIRMEVVEDGKLVGLEIHIEKAEYFDDAVEKVQMGMGVDSREDSSSASSLAWLSKNVRVMGVTVSLDDEPVPYTFTSAGSAPGGCDSMGSSPPELYKSALEEIQAGVGSDPCDSAEEGDPPRAIPVPIGVFTGRSDIKVIMKGKENMEGPKMDASAHLGAFHTMLSPRQLGTLIKVISAFCSPPETSSEAKGALNWRMGPEDYAKVGQVLEQDMRSGQFEEVMHTFTEDCNYLATGDPMFHTMEPAVTHFDMNVSVSSLDSGTTLSTIPRSVTPDMEQRRQEKAARKARESLAKAASDPSGEITKVLVSVATVSVCLLHEELCEPGGLGNRTWAQRMSELASTYFTELKVVSTVGQKSLWDFRDAVSRIVQRDHLGLLCKPVSVLLHDRQVRNVQKWHVDASIHQTELVECLFGSSPQGPCFQDNAPTRIPQYCEMVTFSNAHASAADGGFTREDLVAAIHLSLETSSKTGPGGRTCRETKVTVKLGNLVTEVDITVQDRLATLISTLSGPPKPSASSFSQPLVDMDQRFQETLQEATLSHHILDFSIATQKASIRLRFPIPNLRPPDQHAPREWWGRTLHKESLLLEVDQLSMQRSVSGDEPASSPICVDLICSKLDVYFQEDFNKQPRLFGSVMQGSGDVGDNFNCPTVRIKMFPPVGTLLMDTMTDEQSSFMEGSNGGLGSLGQSESRPGSTPFCSRKEYLHGNMPIHGDDCKGFNNLFEGVAPGSKKEMQQFMDVSMSNTALLVDITAPKVLVTLHDKQFLELLYNRINNDLLLWEPQSPSPPEAFASGQSLNIQPQYLHPDMLKSFGESTYSNNGSEEDLPSAVSQVPAWTKSSVRHPSSMCLALNIGEGKLFCCVPVREEDNSCRDGSHGELALLVKEGSMLVSVGHDGNKDLRYLVIGANRAQLFHAGCVADNLVAPVTMESLDTLTFESRGSLDHLTSRIVRSEPTVPVEPLKNVGTGEGSEDMVSVAVEIKLDAYNNCKYFDVAAAIRGAMLRHEMHLTGEAWITQIMDLVNLLDYPIEGYVAPEVLTNLNIGITGCAIDYRMQKKTTTGQRQRPKNFELMTLRSLLIMEKFRLAASINTEAKYTSFKFLFEEFNLWLSDRDVVEVNVPRDYIQIAQLGILEVGLRLGQADEKGAKTFLWFGNNRLEFKVCYDSAAAFISLVNHIAYDRDLGRPKEVDPSQVEELQHLNLDERTEAENLHVEECIADALKEQKTPHDSPVKEGKSRPLYFVPPVEGVGMEPGPSGYPVAGGEAMCLVELSDPEEEVVSVEEGDDEAFTIIDAPKLGKASRGGEPIIMKFVSPEEFKKLLVSAPRPATINLLVDDLKTPSDWPVPEFKCMLGELDLDVCIYDGRDFGSKKDADKSVRSRGNRERFIFSAPKAEEAKQKKKSAHLPIGARPLHWKSGKERNENIMVRLYVSKFRVQYERYHESEEKSRRLVVVAHKVEVEDHLAKELSSYNKLLYWPGFDLSHECANMVRLKMMWQRPDDRYSTEEVSALFTLQPINVNLNQNTYIFLEKFATNVKDALTSFSADDIGTAGAGRVRDPSLSPSQTPRRKKSVSAERAPIFSTEGGQPREELKPVADDSLMHFGDSSSCTSQASARPERPPRIDVEPEDNPTFIKSFVMTRDIPVTMCYCGTGAGIRADTIKTMAYTALQGLVQLENVKITLKCLELKKGYRGVDKLIDAIREAWCDHVKNRQITSVVGGLGPLHIVSLILQGLIDFVKMPYDQYRKDGRVWRGFQKGAVSLKVCTQTAILDLLKKIIDSILVCSSVCFDILSSSKNPNRIRDISKTPRDIREGMSGAVQVVREGITCTIADLVRDASQQREQKGLPGAMGYIVKNIPATLCAMPMQVLSAGADQCVTGIRHEVRPDLLKEAQEKYKELN